MKPFEFPEIVIIELMVEDIITVSEDDDFNDEDLGEWN